MRASLSAGRILPCRRATLRSGKTSFSSRWASFSAARTSSLFCSSMAAQTTKAWRPADTSPRTRS